MTTTLVQLAAVYFLPREAADFLVTAFLVAAFGAAGFFLGEAAAFFVTFLVVVLSVSAFFAAEAFFPLPKADAQLSEYCLVVPLCRTVTLQSLLRNWKSRVLSSTHVESDAHIKTAPWFVPGHGVVRQFNTALIRCSRGPCLSFPARSSSYCRQLG